MTDNFSDSFDFITRHIGPNDEEQNAMLASLGYKDMASFINAVIPDVIRQDHAPNGIRRTSLPSSTAHSAEAINE